MRGRLRSGALTALTVTVGMSVVAARAEAGTTYGQPVQIASLPHTPSGIASTSAGQLFVTQTNASTVQELTPGSSGYTSSTIGSGLSGPDGAAVDANGNVYVADAGNNRIVKLSPSNKGGYSQSTFADVSDPVAIAVDPAADVFVLSDDTNSTGTLVEFAAGSSGSPTTIATDLPDADAVAVAESGSGTIYVGVHAKVAVLTPTGSGGYTESSFGGVGSPFGLATDTTGNVFVAFGYLVRESPGGTVTQISQSGPSWTGVAVDGDDDLYVVSQEGGELDEYVAQTAPDDTATKVICSGTQPAGTAQTCTATVTDTDEQSVTPSGGTVDFSANGSGTFSGGASCQLSGGSCSVQYTPSIVGDGSQTITGTYQGTTSFDSSSGSSVLMISGLTPRVALTCVTPTTKQRAQVALGEAIVLPCTATVRPPSGKTNAPVPTGTVMFSATPSADTGEEIEPGTCTLAPSGTGAKCATTFVTATPDQYEISAAYSSDANYLAGTATAKLNTGSANRPTRATGHSRLIVALPTREAGAR